MAKLYEMIGENSNSERLRRVYEEYVKHESAEAKYVKSLDLLDMFVQAYEYELINKSEVDLSEFFKQAECESHRHQFEPSIRACIDELMDLRAQRVNFLPPDSNLNTILRMHHRFAADKTQQNIKK